MKDIIDDWHDQKDHLSSISTQNQHRRNEKEIYLDYVSTVFDSEVTSDMAEQIILSDAFKATLSDKKNGRKVLKDIIDNVKSFFGRFVYDHESPEEFRSDLMSFFTQIADNAHDSKYNIEELVNIIIKIVINSCRDEEETNHIFTDIIDSLSKVVEYDDSRDEDHEGLTFEDTYESYESLQDDEYNSSYEDDDWN